MWSSNFRYFERKKKKEANPQCKKRKVLDFVETYFSIYLLQCMHIYTLLHVCMYVVSITIILFDIITHQTHHTQFMCTMYDTQRTHNFTFTPIIRKQYFWSISINWNLHIYFQQKKRQEISDGYNSNFEAINKKDKKNCCTFFNFLHLVSQKNVYTT